MKFDWAKNKEVTNRRDFYGHISSDPVRVCRCVNATIDCNNTHPPVLTKKGERFTLSLIALDQVGKPVHATIISSLKSVNSGIDGLGKGQKRRRISEHCTELDYNVFSAQSDDVLEVYADGPCRNQGISKQDVHLTFKRCTYPIGFEIDNTNKINCSCECDRKLATFVNNCYLKDETIELKSNVWIEYVNSTNITDYVIHACPFDYCVEKPANISLTDQDEQCAFNRTGTLCGECEQGLSLVFASSQCQQCSNYYLILLLPFALAGVALVAFILMLNMTVAKGTIHGLIFYANILAANQPIFQPFHEQNILTVFISWLNLDLGIKTCFYSGMNSYGKLMLQLVFPMYVFLLIAIIMILCDRSQSIARLLVRLAHILTTAFANDTVVILFVVTLSSALLLTKATSKTIYSQHAVCFLETTFLVNLGLLASSSLYIRLVDSIEHQSTLTTVSMSVTFIAFLVVVLYHILETCRVKPNRLLQRAHGAIRKHPQYERLPGIDQEELPANDNGQREPGEQLVAVANVQSGMNNDITPPIIRHAVPDDQLREPALDILVPVQPEDYDLH